MLFEIASKTMRVKIDTHGAEIKSIVQEGFGEIVWQGKKALWDKSSPVLFPIVGKLQDDRYYYEGKEYKMPIHGFAMESEFEVVKHNGDRLELLLKPNTKMHAHYPFGFLFFVTFTVGIKLTVSYKVINNGKKTMPIGFGAHTGFKLFFSENKKRTQQGIKFEQNESCKQLIIGEKGLVIEEKNYCGDTIDFEKEKLVGTAFVLKGVESQYVDLLTYASDDISKKIRVSFKGADYLAFWAKNVENGFVCIEPWAGCADYEIETGDIMKKKGINLLQSNEEINLEYSIKCLNG